MHCGTQPKPRVCPVLYLIPLTSAELDPVIGPTVGFSAPIRKHVGGASVVFYDLGGGNRIRGVWPNYFPDVSRGERFPQRSCH